MKAIMVEVRRDLYMDENTGARSERFEEIRTDVKRVVELLEAIR